MRHITKTQLEVLQERIAKGYTDAIRNGRRARVRYEGDVWQATLVDLPDDNSVVEDWVGCKAVAWERRNMGTQAAPVYYTAVDWFTFVFTGDMRSNLCIIVDDELEGVKPAFKPVAPDSDDYAAPWEVLDGFLSQEFPAADFYMPAILNDLCTCDEMGNFIFVQDAINPGAYLNAIKDARVEKITYTLLDSSGLEVYHGCDEAEVVSAILKFCEFCGVDPGYLESIEDAIDFVDDPERNEWLGLEVASQVAAGGTFRDLYGHTDGFND